MLNRHLYISRCVISPLIAKSRLLEAAAETPEATAGGWRHAQLPGFNMFVSTQLAA